MANKLSEKLFKFNKERKEILKGEKILAISNYNLPMSDKIFLDSAIINLNFLEKVLRGTLLQALQ